VSCSPVEITRTSSQLPCLVEKCPLNMQDIQILTPVSAGVFICIRKIPMNYQSVSVQVHGILGEAQ